MAMMKNLVFDGLLIDAVVNMIVLLKEKNLL